MSKTLASYWRFLVAGLVYQGQTGAIVPSQRFLIAKMISAIPPTFRGTLLELGPGTGALTLRLAERCPGARILACEINPALAGHLRHRLAIAGLHRRVEVVVGAAQRLLASLSETETQRVPYIISGIPLGNLGREPALELIEGIAGALRGGGMYIQFQHSLLDRQKIRARFSKLRTVPVFLNFPPAVIYYAQKSPVGRAERGTCGA
jgi:phospholipid N-methyltransferase